MSMRYYGASAVVLKDDFVLSIVKEEHDALVEILKNHFDDDDANLDDVANALAYEDSEELGDLLGDNCQKFLDKLQELHKKFKEATGFFLLHVYITDEHDDTDLSDGHHFALDFSEVYKISEEAKAISKHWKYEHWAAFG